VLIDSDAVITVSDGLRDAVLQLGASEERVHTIYQGIDTQLFAPGDQAAARKRLGLTEEVAIMVWVGRMVPVKGLEVLIAACADLQRRRRRFRLCLIGDGPERQTVATLARSHNLSNSIRFVGPLGPSSLPDWYRAADVAVLSSWSEGLPNVLRESLACGTPFVATDVGSIREIAFPGCAELTPPGDSRAIAHAVERVLDGPHRTAAQHYQPRTWSECALEVAELFAHCSTASDAGRRAEAICV
jgi:glycosyltransferase involved in cell wall biosynthesis